MDVSLSSGSDLIREEDDTWVATWGPFLLRSAFQPIFRFHAGRLGVAGFECLLRPQRDGKSRSPAGFLASLTPAERMHVEALARLLHLANTAECLPSDAAIFLNFDPSVFSDHAAAVATVADLRRVASERRIDPRRLVCEVTEHEAGCEHGLADFVGMLRQSGFRVAIDDYGVEASDMHRVDRLRPDIVKFDAGLIQRLMQTAAGFALLAAMVATFTRQGIESVLEGIESHEQVQLAERSGVAMVQGFGLGRPEFMPVEPSFETAHASPAFAVSGGIRRPAVSQRRSAVFGRRAEQS